MRGKPTADSSALHLIEKDSAMTKYLTIKELSSKLGGRSRSAIYVDLATGRLPRPIKLGGRIYWGEDDVEAHLRKSLEEEV